MNRRTFVATSLASVTPFAPQAPKGRALALIPEVYVPIGTTSFDAAASFRTVDNVLVQGGTVAFYWQRQLVAQLPLVNGAATCPIPTGALAKGVHYYQVRFLPSRSYNEGVFTAGVCAV